MPRDINAGQQTVLDSRQRGVTQLIDLEFGTGTVYVTPFSKPIPANGQTYVALGGNLGVTTLRESEVSSRDKVAISLTSTDPALLTTLIGPASVYRGRKVRIWAQLINEVYMPVQAAVLLFTGIMENFEVQRDTPRDGKTRNTVSLYCYRVGISRFKNVQGLRMNDHQQQLEYPGDRGLEYTADLVQNPPVWVSRAFQEQG